MTDRWASRQLHEQANQEPKRLSRLIPESSQRAAPSSLIVSPFCSEKKQCVCQWTSRTFLPLSYSPLNIFSSMFYITGMTLPLTSMCNDRQITYWWSSCFTDWQNGDPKESSDFPKVITEPEPNQGPLTCQQHKESRQWYKHWMTE